MCSTAERTVLGSGCVRALSTAACISLRIESSLISFALTRLGILIRTGHLRLAMGLPWTSANVEVMATTDVMTSSFS